MNGTDQSLGIAQVRQLQILARRASPGASFRLTSIPIHGVGPPETPELDLTDHEGQAIMVRGHDGGDWIYSAEVIDQAGPILTAVVQQLFGEPSEAS